MADATTSAAPTQSSGPTSAPPTLPEGWIAQWDPNSQKYFYVYTATAHTQWDVPTGPPVTSTSSPPPQQPYDASQDVYVEQTTSVTGPGGETVTQTARGGGAFGTLNSLLGSSSKTGSGGGQPNNLLNMGMSLLSGKQSHGGTTQTGGSHAGGGASQLLNMGMSLLNKPSKPQQAGGYGSQTTQASGGGGGLMGLASGFLGGHSQHNQQNAPYGQQYSGHQQYSPPGQPPASTYQPPNQSGNYDQHSQQYGGQATYNQSSPYGAPPQQQYGTAPQQPYQLPGQHQQPAQQYGAPPGHSYGSAVPPQQQYPPPPQHQQSYGAPPSGGYGQDQQHGGYGAPPQYSQPQYGSGGNPPPPPSGGFHS